MAQLLFTRDLPIIIWLIGLSPDYIAIGMKCIPYFFMNNNNNGVELPYFLTGGLFSTKKGK